MAAVAGIGAALMVLGLRRRPQASVVPSVKVPGIGSRAAMQRAARRVERDLVRKRQLTQDAAMVGRALEVHALIKLGGMVAAAVTIAAVTMLFSVALGVPIPPLVIVMFAAGAALVGWWLPDSMLKTQAEQERERFKQSSEAWLELVAQLVTAGADEHAALNAAAGCSNQPAFTALLDALAEASARGEPPWTGLRRLAETRRLRFMEPFIASLELAGTTGAGARQAIISQVDAARSKSLAEADAAAASAGEKMGAPLALIGGAFMVLMGYPPMAGILNSDAIPTGF